MKRTLFFVATFFISMLTACLPGGAESTAIPADRPSDFEVQVATPTLAAMQTASAAPVIDNEPALILPMSDAPTHTPAPTRPASPAPVITATIALEPSAELLTPTVVITDTATPAPPPTKPITPDPPLQGGDWDFEADFIPWPNPYGEPCPGASVASGWTAFVEDGPYGSSCMNENLYRPNVFSGVKSQEITFDFISAHSGVYRTVSVKARHRYTIIAHAKHDHSLSPVEMALGVDLTGGSNWQADTVQWFPWDGTAEDAWLPTEKTVTASSDTMTVFIKGFHPLAEQGGKTVVDNVIINHLGP